MDRKVQVCVSLLFVAAIGLGAITHVPVAWRALSRRAGFEKSVAAIHSGLLERFKWKDAFVDISGLYARIMGRRLHNQVVKLANGHLQNALRIEPSDEEMAKSADSAVRIRDLFAWLKGRGIGALYLQAPTKMDVGGMLYPYEVKHRIYEKADLVCAELQTNGCEVLDMRNRLAATVDDVSRNFYVADHHWRIEAAFGVFPAVVDRMLSILGQDGKDVSQLVDSRNWLCQTREDLFLGSWGRRVGRFFAGLDDISWYEPKFNTHLSCAVPRVELITVGKFSDALVRSAGFLDGRLSPHANNAYCLYVGGNFPLVMHRNASAPSHARILMVVDSFALPVQAFLSTVFSEIDVLDLRSFGEMPLCDYVDAYGPDLVVFLYNPGSIGAEKTFAFGLSPEQRAKPISEELPCGTSFEIAKTSDGVHYGVVADETMLKKGGLYRLVLGNLAVDGNCPGVTVCLRNPDSGEFKEMRVVDSEYAAGHAETLAFKIPTAGRWELVAFAGRRSSTAAGIRIGKVSLVCVRSPSPEAPQPNPSIQH